MNFSDILNIESIQIALSAENKTELLKKMLDLAAHSGLIENKEEAMNEVFERERIMSTGVGKGFALPHAKTNAVKDTVAALAILDPPIDFESLDDEPVRIVFLLLDRENNVGNHLRLLSKISRFVNNESFRSQLLQSESPQEILEIFRSVEEKE